MNTLIVQGSHSTPVPNRHNKPSAPPVLGRQQQHARFPSTPSVPRISGGGIPRLDVLRESRLHQTFQYKSVSGARLKSHCVGFAEYGPDGGHPVIVIGGYGCTRLVGIMFEALAHKHCLRMIWPERPG